MAPPQRPRKGGKSGKSNVSLLTEGAKYIQRKKKSKANEVEKVVFDDDARRDYLTGFHKRRVAKIEEKRKRQNEEAHQEHLVERKRVSERDDADIIFCFSFVPDWASHNHKQRATTKMPGRNPFLLLLFV